MYLLNSFIKKMMISIAIITSYSAYATQYNCMPVKDTQLQFIDKTEYANKKPFFHIKDISQEGAFTININDPKNTAILVFSHMPSLKENTPINLSLVSKDKEQITFSGLLNQNPVLLTFYPQTKISLYSLHWINNKSNKNHIDISIGYAHCGQDISK